MVPGVPGLPGQNVMSAPARPFVPDSATVPLPGLVASPVWARAGRAADVTTTPLSAQVSPLRGFILTVTVFKHRDAHQV